MTPQQLHQTAVFIREQYPPPDATMTPGRYVSCEAMYTLAHALDRTATAVYAGGQLGAGGAPAALHEAIDRAWSAIREDADEPVREQLRQLGDDDLARAAFAISVVRALGQSLRANRHLPDALRRDAEAER